MNEYYPTFSDAALFTIIFPLTPSIAIVLVIDKALVGLRGDGFRENVGF